MKNLILITSALCLYLLAGCNLDKAKNESDLKLWYDEPALYFEQSLVLGNGKWELRYLEA